MQTMDQIEAVRIHAGFWQLKVNGSLRPVYAGRQGRSWVVQGPSRMAARANEIHHGSFRTLADAKSMMIVVWWALDTERELARHEALEQEYRRLKDLARSLRVTYSIETDASTDLPRKIAIVKALIEDTGVRVLYGTRI